MVCGNSSGALSGGGKSSIGLRARMPNVASRSTRTKGGAANQTARGSSSSRTREPAQPPIKPRAGKISIIKRSSTLAKHRIKKGTKRRRRVKLATETI